LVALAAAAKWHRLGLPPLDMRPPWHGYLLGDCRDQPEDFARKCVSGDWEQNGVNTFARRRSGITPEAGARHGDREEAGGRSEPTHPDKSDGA
jgi:hypothetical protein